MILIGAGQHAMVLAEIVIASSDVHLFGFVDNNPEAYLPKFVTQEGATMIGGDDAMEELRETSHFHLAIGAQSEAARQRLMVTIEQLDLKLQSIIHPSAIIAPSAELGSGIAMMAQATIQTGAQVGDFSCVNTNAVVDHDCQIGKNVFVQPGATLAGSVRVGDNTVIGVGASVRDGIDIGRNCMIGGGAFVTRNIPDNSTAIGVPAKVVDVKDTAAQA